MPEKTATENPTPKTSPFLEMNAAPPPPRRKRVRVVGAVIALVLLAVLSAAVWYRLVWGGLVSDAVIDGMRTAVVASSDGQVSAVHARVGQVVTPGQALIVVRSMPGSGGEADARAALETLRVQLGTSEEAERRARDDMEQASVAHARALLALRGAGQPVPGSQAAAGEVQRLNEDVRRAKTTLEGAKTRFERASSTRQATELAWRQVREGLLLAQAQRRQQVTQTGQGPADYADQAGQAVLTASIGGRIGAIGVEPGTPVSRGQTLAVIESVLPEQMWITGRVAPSRLTDLRPEQVFSVQVAELPELMLCARLEAVLPTQPGAQSNGQPAGVPVRLRLIGYDPLTMPQLTPGQAVEVRAE